jgi:DNA-binding NtrC family response regulator
VINDGLNLVSFGKAADASSFENALRCLGHHPVRVSAQRWLEAGLQFLPRGAQILYFSDSDFPADRVLGVLEKWSPAVFAVFQCGEVSVQAEIAQRSRDFLCWPCNEAELATRVLRFLGNRTADSPGFDCKQLLQEFIPLNLVGRSRLFLETLQRIKRLARCDAPVLIEGETGTGKELAARAIHYLGGRRDHPFIPVNCGAIPENLVENELFGHERGAFTDAKEAQQGLVTQAEGGTLFLDEVEALGSKAQAALLRFLQDHQYRPLGSRRLLRADVRIVAASNCNLDTLVGARQFRQDLLYRLRVMSVTLPSLRDRVGDAELLAEHFLARHCAQYGVGPMDLDLSTRQWIRGYAWPGNVRELENVMLREILMADGNTLRFGPATTQTDRRSGTTDRRHDMHVGPMHVAKKKVIADFEKNLLYRLLEETGGNVSAAARRAGKERRAFGKLLTKHGIDRRGPWARD